MRQIHFNTFLYLLRKQLPNKKIEVTQDTYNCDLHYHTSNQQVIISTDGVNQDDLIAIKDKLIEFLNILIVRELNYMGDIQIIYQYHNYFNTYRLIESNNKITGSILITITNSDQIILNIIKQ